MTKPYRSLLQRVFAVTAALLFFCSAAPRAQVGFRVAQLRPWGELSYAFKRAPSFEAFYGTALSDNQRLRGRAGLGYANLKPKLDTFRIAQVQLGSNQVHPGYEVYFKFNIAYVFMDLSYAVVKVGNLSVNTGLGFSGGIFNMHLTDGVEGIYSGAPRVEYQDLMMGLRTKLSVDYTIKKKVIVFSEFMNVAMRGGGGSEGDGLDMGISHNTVGIGLMYFFHGVDGRSKTL